MRVNRVSWSLLALLVLGSVCVCAPSYAVTIEDLDLRTTVSATEYGAVPNDGLDDSTAINNALTACQRVYLPAGTYNLSNSIILPTGGSLRGASSAGVTLLFNGTVADYAIKNYSTEDTTAAQATDCTISDMTINIQSANCLGCISILNSGNLEIRRIVTNNYYPSISKTAIDYGVRIRGTLTFRVEDVKLRSASCGLSLEATSRTQCNGGRLVNVYVTPATMGFNINGATSVTLQNCIAERIRRDFTWGVVPFSAYPGNCYYIRNCNTVRLENCYAEGFDYVFQIRDNYMTAIDGMHICNHATYIETYYSKLGTISDPTELANVSVIGDASNTGTGIGELAVRRVDLSSPHHVRLRGLKGNVYLKVESSVANDQIDIASCKFDQIVNTSDIRLNFLDCTTVPASATATGINGQWAYDSNYLYRCVAANTWRRTALSTW